ncbi:MAG: hypothetical protein ACI8VJ_000110 [Polaribacter sp.]|jgi:hypothetical protein
MEKSRENNDKMGFVNEGSIDDVSKKHTKYLGTGIPEGYFETSKTAILDKIKSEIDVNKIKEKKPPVFWVRPSIKYMAAASLVFIFGMTVWLQNATKKEISNTNFELLSFNEDYLMNSLLVEDADFEAFADATLIYEIVIKAEVSERKIDALFLNSLFLEDSLIDNYTSDFFLDVIIL